MSCSAIPQPPHLGQQKWLICVFLFLYNPPALRTCSYKSVCTWSGLCGSINFNFIKSSSWSPLWWEQSDCIWGLIQDLFFPWEACLNLTLWTPVSSVLNSAESTLLGNFWVIIHHLKPRGTCHQGMPFSHSGEVTPHAGKPLVFNLLCWIARALWPAVGCLIVITACICLDEMNPSWDSLEIIIVLYCICLCMQVVM